MLFTAFDNYSMPLMSLSLSKCKSLGISFIVTQRYRDAVTISSLPIERERERERERESCIQGKIIRNRVTYYGNQQLKRHIFVTSVSIFCHGRG